MTDSCSSTSWNKSYYGPGTVLPPCYLPEKLRKALWKLVCDAMLHEIEREEGERNDREK